MDVILTQVLWFGFLVCEVMIKKERPLSILVLLALFVAILMGDNVLGDVVICLFVAIIGSGIELVLIFGKIQKWSSTSLWIMPLWLPLLWGLGGLAIVRLGSSVIPMFGIVVFVIVGALYSLLMEVFLGKISRLQHWKNGWFFGVPPWLIVSWAFGFPIIWWVGETLRGVF